MKPEKFNEAIDHISNDMILTGLFRHGKHPPAEGVTQLRKEEARECLLNMKTMELLELIYKYQASR